MSLPHVAWFTFKDLLRSKFIWNIPVLGFLLVLTTFVAREFTYGVPERVATNLGLAALNLSAYGIAFFAGVMLIRSEAESRTIYLIISRPVGRVEFLIGKLAGVGLFLLLNLSALTVICLLILWGLGAYINGQLPYALLFILLESLLLLIVVVVLSMVSNMALTLIFGVLLLVGGHAVGGLENLTFVQSQPSLKFCVDYYHWIFPAFYKLNFKDYAVYAQQFPWDRLTGAFGYWLAYSAGLLALGCGIILDKDFD